MAMSLSVAEAAALINVAVIIFTLSFPLLVTLVTVGSLEKNVNAATWSVFCRLANQSLWPNILRTDAAGTKNVDKRIRTLSLLATSGTIVLAFSAAVTPLGLYTSLQLKESKDTLFTYAPDDSVIGKSTPPRTGYSFNRVCGTFSACPGNVNPWVINEFINSTWWNVTYDNPSNGTISTSIAANITDAFTSATEHSDTVAGIFDIEYRNFVNYNADDSNNITGFRDHGEPRTQSNFMFYQDFIVDSRTKPIEGLIVSTDDHPGIGFRNHTLPPSSEFGFVWAEDLLWLEPETACTSLNISFDYEMPLPDYGDLFIRGSLIDRGGFVNMDQRVYNMTLYYNRTNTQDDPRLSQKSWRTAALTNAIIWGFLNHTSSDLNSSFVGKQYALNKRLKTWEDPDVDPRWMSFSSFGWWAKPDSDKFSSTWDPALPPPLNSLMQYTNASDWSNMSEGYVGGTVLPYGHDIGKVNVAGMAGGLLLAPGFQTDEDGNKLPFTGSIPIPRSKWSRPIYSCVSAVKASVKTVRFHQKRDALLSKLEITSIAPKSYKSQDEWPIWAVETVIQDNYIHTSTDSVSPFWGIVTEDVSRDANVTSRRSPFFYLPTPYSLFEYDQLSSIDSAAGANVPLGFLSAIYDSYSPQETVPEITGSNDWRLLERMSRLSGDSGSASQIVNLLWTNLVANAVVGTKSPLSRKIGGNVDTAYMPARPYENALAYDWRYAIPALAFAALYSALLVWSLLLFCVRKISFTGLRFMLDQSSAGRSMTTERHQAGAEADFASTKKWAKVRGGEMVRLTMADADRKSPNSSSYALLTPKSASQASISIRYRAPVNT